MATLIYSIRAYALPLVIVFGLISNSLSILIMRRIKTSAGFFVLILAVVDTGNSLVF